MIRKDGGPSWAVTVTKTNDMSLNFALYVGCSYGFISKKTYSGQVPLWPYKQLGETPRYFSLKTVGEMVDRTYTEKRLQS